MDAETEAFRIGSTRTPVPPIPVFQISQAFVAIVFAFFISDFRRKKDMVPLVREKWTLALKISCLIPLVIYAHVLVTLEWVSAVDLLALGLTIVGMILVSKSKLDLSKHHTWAGYCLRSSRLFAEGIYAYMRHPMYTGIFAFILGLFLTIVPHAEWYMALTATAALVYALVFLAHSAVRESEMLERKLGPEFLAYKNQVHFCLPLRKYTETPN